MNISISIETYGCSMNYADSEMIAGLLKEQGFNITDFKDSDIVIVNTCTVKTPTENKILKKIRELEKSKRKVIVSGCIPAAIPELINKFPDFSFIGVNVTDIVDAVLCTAGGKRFVRIHGDTHNRCKVSLPKIRRNPVTEIIPISEGCVGSCTYCQTKLARGKLNSYPEELILKQIQSAVNDGVKEVWVTSQDNGAYGLDLDIGPDEANDSGTSLPKLLDKIQHISGNFKIRVGMMNPNHVLDFLDELIESYRKNDKIYKFIHIPVQSGDDSVLADMNRRYTAGDFKKIVSEFRNNIKGITISTDVIAGFPTETEEAFLHTIKLLEKTTPDVLNISRYWTRAGTKAAEMKQHPGSLTNQRSRIINNVFRKIALENNRQWIGWEGIALISEKAKSGGFWVARNFAYKQILVKPDNDKNKDLLGKEINVKIKDAKFCDLRGEIL